MGTAADPPLRRLRLAIAGCRCFTEPVVEMARAYAGLAEVVAVPCETESDRPQAHLEEPDTVLTAPTLARLGLEAPDVVVVPPGHRGEEPGVEASRIAPVVLDPPCLLGEPARPPGAVRAVLLRPALVPPVLAAAMLERPDAYAYLPFVSADHLESQLAIARRAGASVLTEPAAVHLAERVGLEATSYLGSPPGCAGVHAVERALARAVAMSLTRQAHAGGGAGAGGLAGPLLAALPPRLGEAGAPDVVALRTGRRFVVVPQASIVYVTSLGGVVTTFADAGRFWTNQTLAEVERRLDPTRFLRIDQSHLVNVTRIAELVPWTHQRYRLVFADAAKSELVLSRDVGRRLRAAVGW